MMERLIGNTPIVRLDSVDSRIFLKLEKNNPGGSVKDRPALFMILDAEKRGLLKNGIVEPTSGNMGIAIAMIGAKRGHRVILTMPETMSVERRKVLKMLGAELVLTPGDLGMKGAIEKAKEIAQETGAHMLQQFENPYNVYSHQFTTGPEILRQMDYQIDAFVAGVGTGGTISGVGRVLKTFFGDRVKVVAVEPAKSPVLSGGQPGKHAIQGIGAGFVPKILDRSVIDEVITVEDEEAYDMARYLAKKEGLLVGVSSGANVAAALKIAQKLGKDARVVTIAPDHAERYLSIL